MTNNHFILYVPIRLCLDCKHGRPAVIIKEIELNGRKIKKREVIKDFARCRIFSKIGKLGGNTAFVPIEFAEICEYFEWR